MNEIGKLCNFTLLLTCAPYVIVFRDMQDRPVITVRRNKLSMWRTWSVLIPSSPEGKETRLMEVKWHYWATKIHLSASFENAPPSADSKSNPLPAQGAGEDVTIELAADSGANIVKFTHNNALIARMKRAAFWPEDLGFGSNTSERRKMRQELSFEIEVARGVDWRIIIAMVSVMDQAMDAMKQAAYGSAASAGSTGVTAGAAGA